MSLINATAGNASATASPFPFAGAVIVQMFEYPWQSIANECSFLGSAGYTHVQVSPPQEHINGTQWWTDYQPVSYNLTSKRGNEADFRNMVSVCSNSGIGIVVDDVINHMAAAPVNATTGIGGTNYSAYSFPGYDRSSFHFCNGSNGAAGITNFANVTEVQTCELLGLQDLAQERTPVRDRIRSYHNTLIDIGVVGFRVDAAKHIDATALGSTFQGLRNSSQLLISQEVSIGVTEVDPYPISRPAFEKNGLVQEFRVKDYIRQGFDTNNTLFSGHIADFFQNSGFGEGWGFIKQSYANVFVSNHDSERDATSLNYTYGPRWKLGHVYLLSWNYGVTTVLSSYRVNKTATGLPNTDQGAPQSPAGLTYAVNCTDDQNLTFWRCDHRETWMSGMAKFRRQTVGLPITNNVTGTLDQIAYGRGSVGYVAINNAFTNWSSTFQTSLPAGSYCNILITGSPNITSCNSTTSISVSSNGTFSANIAALDAVALLRV